MVGLVYGPGPLAGEPRRGVRPKPEADHAGPGAYCPPTSDDLRRAYLRGWADGAAAGHPAQPAPLELDLATIVEAQPTRRPSWSTGEQLIKLVTALGLVGAMIALLLSW